MSRPYPIVHTPTADSREAFLRTIWAGGLEWCGEGAQDVEVHASLIEDARNSTHWNYSFYTGGRNVMFLTSSEAAEYLHEGSTLVNSPRHFVSYIKRLPS